MNRTCLLIVAVFSFGPTGSLAGFTQLPELQPKPANYQRLAFYPKRWRKANIDFEMLAWEGRNVVLLTKKGGYDAKVLTAFVKRLDDAWQVYSELIGSQPRRFKQINGKPTICAIPRNDLSCGYGCGFVGATGIEASAFYSIDLPEFQKRPDGFQHYYFYEMGRNFFVFGDRHSLFTTGYAVFMRYVCMDQLNCFDRDARTRKTIEGCEEIYAESDIRFFDAFTNLGSGEKSNRLKNAKGRVISPSDQPVMYATAMLKLRRDYGGDAWVKKFFHKMRESKSQRATDTESAKTQVYNWLVCASHAAGRDLTPVFADRWRMPFTKDQRRLMQSVDFTAENASVVKLVNALLSGGLPRKADAEQMGSIVPTPKSVTATEGQGGFELKGASRIVYRDDMADVRSLQPLANVIAGELELITGMRPRVVSFKPGMSLQGDVLLRTSDEGPDHPEGYRLVSDSSAVSVVSQAYEGVAHGSASLLQLMNQQSFSIPSLRIADEPTAAYRAVMIDIARSVHSIGVIKDVVRLCRLYKVRYLHLHLTDDQNFTFPFPPVTDNIERNFCYSLEELNSLVTYADDRGVTIIPELDLPGHSTKLRQSGYLSPSKNDADVASPANYEKMGVIVDAMLDVFQSSPYFHIGGDESGAGRNLVPFLAAMNKRVRKRGKRLLVWEGFHGAPTAALPAEGDDRVIVMAWESSYNAPWDLLNNGYELINASWKPMYLTGGYGGLIHPGSTGGKRFLLEDIYRWNKNTFMHWEPGRPIFEDRGPNDPNRNDGEWNAGLINKENQILGGQLLYWEQHEGSVIHFLKSRVPVMAERLWNPENEQSFGDFVKRANSVGEAVLPILQPVEILPVAEDQSEPVVGLYQPYEGDQTQVTLRNRTKIQGQIRYSTGGWSGSLNSPNFRPVPKPSTDYKEPLTARGAYSVRAELLRSDGTPVEGHSWQYYNNWPNRVEVTEYDIGRRTMRNVPDLAAMPETKVLRRYKMPFVRGLMRNVAVRGQLTRADLVAPADGEYVLELRTQSGHATLFLDLNQNGRFEPAETLVKDSPNDESGQFAKVKLKKGQRYGIRIDHATNMPRPVLLLFVTRPDNQERAEISKYLQLPK
ncbi:MAG: family 20 glycosylhydrolase [Planctomycetaceae bacterium]